MFIRNLYYTLIVLFACIHPAFSQVSHPVHGDKHPWTSLPDVKGNKFRFVLLPDRTGGEMGGVFDDTCGRLNAENADFFITIGDMIDGYTQNPEYLQQMWSRYEQSISVLKAPVFFIPGNHDISNQMMDEVWKSKFGQSYYHIIIGDNLFLMLNTEEGGKAGISDEQSRYFLDVMEKYASGRNILLFMHRPFWNSGNMMGYEAIDKALIKYKDRTVVFSGHEHRYMKIIRNDIPHYMVATLGGGSQMRGVSLGEFHHYMVIDVAGDKISIKNVLHTGEVIPDDVVNATNLKEVDALGMGTWLKVIPAVARTSRNKALDINVVYSNQIDNPLLISGQLPTGNNYKFSARDINITIPANTVDTVTYTLSGNDILDIEHLDKVHINLDGSYIVNDQKIESQASMPLVLDYIRQCTKTEQTIVCNSPSYIKEDWDWKGANDGRFEFDVRHDGKKIYLRIKTYDEKLILDKDPQALQDKLYLQYSDSRNTNEQAYWMLTADGNVTDMARTSAYNIKATCHTEDNSLIAGIEIPIDAKVKEFRVNIGFMDHDNPLNTKPSVLWWKPLWGSASDYGKSGVFEIK